jgi:hypothetical protein
LALSRGVKNGRRRRGSRERWSTGEERKNLDPQSFFSPWRARTHAYDERSPQRWAGPADGGKRRRGSCGKRRGVRVGRRRPLGKAAHQRARLRARPASPGRAMFVGRSRGRRGLGRAWSRRREASRSPRRFRKRRRGHLLGVLSEFLKSPPTPVFPPGERARAREREVRPELKLKKKKK